MTSPYDTTPDATRSTREDTVKSHISYQTQRLNITPVQPEIRTRSYTSNSTGATCDTTTSDSTITPVQPCTSAAHSFVPATELLAFLPILRESFNRDLAVALARSHHYGTERIGITTLEVSMAASLVWKYGGFR